MIEWLRQRSLPNRVLLYAAAVLLAFALAAGVGATTALMIQGNLGLPAREEAGSDGEPGNAPERQVTDADQAQEQEAGDEQEKAASQRDETEYVSRVGDIQASAVETFMESHDQVVRYDAVTADDVVALQNNQADLQDIAEQVADLETPQRHREQYVVFRSAIDELHRATQVAYGLAADPTAATQTNFDEYDRHVNEASALLKRSNELLGKDYRSIEGVRRVNPLS